MPSNPTLPEDVRRKVQRLAWETFNGDPAVDESVSLARTVDAIAPLIIEWARKDQAETIIEWIEGKNLGGVYPDFQNETEYHAALRAQFTAETGGE